MLDSAKRETPHPTTSSLHWGTGYMVNTTLSATAVASQARYIAYFLSIFSSASMSRGTGASTRIGSSRPTGRKVSACA